MCGRFSLDVPAEQMAMFFALTAGEPLPAFEPRFNIAPTQPVVAILADAATGQRGARYLRWGLVPTWAKDEKIGSKLINARAETLAEKPSFRGAFRHRRCLIPASGFYEWKRVGDRKQPYMIRKRDHDLLAFAGLWEVWQSPAGLEIMTCTVITTAANALIQALHDRMPAILDPDDFELWLDPAIANTGKLARLLKPYPGEQMEYFPVNPLVNRVANEGPACSEPLHSNDRSGAGEGDVGANGEPGQLNLFA